mmetsp:Transcript_1063/g.3404  ORF Transcript_1063/g.3404 Transcript_1063/m.3404 type:complete len:252 (+) Transcript_1063:1015-1770(+)
MGPAGAVAGKTCSSCVASSHATMAVTQRDASLVRPPLVSKEPAISLVPIPTSVRRATEELGIACTDETCGALSLQASCWRSRAPSSRPTLSASTPTAPSDASTAGAVPSAPVRVRSACTSRFEAARSAPAGWEQTLGTALPSVSAAPADVGLAASLRSSLVFGAGGPRGPGAPVAGGGSGAAPPRPAPGAAAESPALAGSGPPRGAVQAAAAPAGPSGPGASAKPGRGASASGACAASASWLPPPSLSLSL